jgi:hypothetical protein
MHLKSRPGCLEDQGISPSSNWPALLGFKPSTGTILPINEHPLHLQIDPVLASKRSVECMWKEDETTFLSSPPDSPTKRPKNHHTPTISGGQFSQLLIEHRCGSKTINMTLNDTTVHALMKNLQGDKLPLSLADSPFASVLTQAQMERMQSMVDPEIADEGEHGTLSDEEENIWDDPPPLTAPNQNQNAAIYLEDNQLFEDAKQFEDRGNGCFTTEETLSIRLLSLMREIGAPLKTYGRIVSLMKDAITDRVSLSPHLGHRHRAIKHFAQRFGMKRLYPTIITQPSPINNRFYPVPVHNTQAMIESLLYSSLAKDDSNLLFPNPEDPLAPPTCRGYYDCRY